jgi:hypothetical protein
VLAVRRTILQIQDTPRPCWCPVASVPTALTEVLLDRYTLGHDPSRPGAATLRRRRVIENDERAESGLELGAVLLTIPPLPVLPTVRTLAAHTSLAGQTRAP